MCGSYVQGLCALVCIAFSWSSFHGYLNSLFFSLSVCVCTVHMCAWYILIYAHVCEKSHILVSSVEARGGLTLKTSFLP